VRIRYTRRAIQHLATLRRFSTERFGTATATATLTTIRRTIDELATYPKRGRPGRVTGTRELVMPGLPFVVAYRITATTIDILAIIHGAQRRPDNLD
jgi:plasmid stabilization system protein ParE